MADEHTSSSHGGLYAILIVIVILLVGGFIWFNQGGGNDGPEIELNVPAPDGGGTGGDTGN